MVIVVPVGGLGTRIKHLLPPNTPKPMMEFYGKPFLEYQFKLLAGQGYKKFVLSVGYGAEKIQKYFGEGKKFGVKIRYVPDGVEPLGFGGCIKNAIKDLRDEYFGIMDGDTYLPINYRRVEEVYNLSEKKALIVVTCRFPKRYDGNISLSNQDISEIRENYSGNTKRLSHVDCGFRIINTQSLKKFPKTRFHMREFFVSLIEKKEVIGYKAERRFREIGNPEAIYDFMRYLKHVS